jgi:hypothetical protein
MSDLVSLLRDLVTANHVLAREGVTDSLGHISVRHPDRAWDYWKYQARDIL